MPWAAEIAVRRSGALLACLAVAGCAGGDGVLSAAAAKRYNKTGQASWYGAELAGRRTASGERFDPAGLTAAHRRLPLGTVAEVTNLATGQSVLVRINDRGPFHGKRLIDLSQGAARRLGVEGRPSQVRVRWHDPRRGGGDVASVMVAPGGAKVAPPLNFGRYLVQVAAFGDERRARALAETLGGMVRRAGTVWRVRLGPFAADEAQRARDDAARRGYADAHLLATD